MLIYIIPVDWRHKNNMASRLKPMNISIKKDKQTPSNKMTYTNKFLTEIIKFIFKKSQICFSSRFSKTGDIFFSLQ